MADPLVQWQQAADGYRAQLAGTPAVLLEDVTELFRYDVWRWQRQCSAEATVSVYTPGLSPRTERLVDAQQTWDDAHPAWPDVRGGGGSGVVPDERRRPGAGGGPPLSGRASAWRSQHGVEDAFATRVAAARQAFADGPDRGRRCCWGC